MCPWRATDAIKCVRSSRVGVKRYRIQQVFLFYPHTISPTHHNGYFNYKNSIKYDEKEETICVSVLKNKRKKQRELYYSSPIFSQQLKKLSSQYYIWLIMENKDQRKTPGILFSDKYSIVCLFPPFLTNKFLIVLFISINKLIILEMLIMACFLPHASSLPRLTLSTYMVTK